MQYTYYPISQEVKATRQWNLVSLQDRYFSSKIILFFFYKKQVFSNLVSIWFGGLRLGHTTETKIATFQIVDQEKWSFLIFYKSLGIPCPPSFVLDFSRKIFRVIFYYLTKFLCLIAFTSWDFAWYIQDFFSQNIGQYRTMKGILGVFAGQFWP